MLVNAGVPEADAKVVSDIYASQDIFQSCFRSESDLDKYLMSMLLKLDPPVATQDTWSFHPASGALRRTASVDVSGVPTRASAQHELQLPFLTPAMPAAQRMTEADREARIKKFGQKLSRGASPFCCAAILGIFASSSTAMPIQSLGLFLSGTVR